MSRTVCEMGKCSGCNACKSICPRNAISIEDSLQFMSASIDENICINCGQCERVCPNINKPFLLKPKKWFQGWAKDEDIRKKSSSGGFAKVISYYYVDNGGYVCSCILDDGEFKFHIACSRNEIENFTGSKYVKSNPGTCYKEIAKLLREKKDVLFIGLPCQAAALKNYIGDRNSEHLMLVDLICHGTPSSKILDLFFEENNKNLKSVKNILFRKNNVFQISGDVSFSPSGVMDYYTVAFITGACYTENCYQCDYACIERVSDITIGDSWGSDLKDEEKKGNSLVLCQSDKALEVIQNLDFEIKPVDLNKAIEFNHQLYAPSKRPEFLDKFYKEIKDGKAFSKVVFRYCRIKCIKQKIKTILSKLGLYNK